MPLNMRPPGAEGPMYAPERDIAYIAPTLLRAAINSLEPSRMPAPLRAFLADQGVTDAQLAAAIEKIAEAQSLFVGTIDVRSPYDALNAVGFLDTPQAAQAIIFAAFGKALIGAWFQGVRDVTHLQDAPLTQPDIVRFYLAASAVSAELRGDEADTSAQDPRIEPAVLQEQLRNLRNYHAEVLRKLHKKEEHYAQLSQEFERCRNEFQVFRDQSWSRQAGLAIRAVLSKIKKLVSQNRT